MRLQVLTEAFFWLREDCSVSSFMHRSCDRPHAGSPQRISLKRRVDVGKNTPDGPEFWPISGVPVA